MRGIIGNEAHYHLSPGEVGEMEGEVVGEEREVAGKRLKRVSPRPPRSCMEHCDARITSVADRT